VAPVVFEVVVLVDLVWEMVRANLSTRTIDSFVIAPVTLGIAPAAGVAGVLGALILARSQFSLANRPFLAGHSEGWVNRPPLRWSVSIHNAGGGIAVIKEVQYRYVLTERSVMTRWMRYDEVVRMLRRDLPANTLVLRDISRGFPMKGGSDWSSGISLFEAGKLDAEALGEFEVRVEFHDTVGDTFEWRKKFGRLLRPPAI
jgi:hypothetical protein